MGIVPAMYLVNTIIFNLIHLKLKKAMVAWWPVFSLTVYKLILSFFNAASVYWTIYEYPSYFANKHFRIIDDPKALEVIPPAEESNLGGVATSEKALHLFTPRRADGN